jgi:hypothetical protein
MDVELHAHVALTCRANPFLTYYIFSAAIMHVYNASFDAALEKPAKRNLAKCMSALEAMEVSVSS